MRPPDTSFLADLADLHDLTDPTLGAALSANAPAPVPQSPAGGRRRERQSARSYPLAVLEAVFRAEDIEGLLALGAPRDEYDAVAAEVGAGLAGRDKPGLTRASETAVVTEVWRNAFGPFDSADWSRRQASLERLVQAILEGTTEAQPGMTETRPGTAPVEP